MTTYKVVVDGSNIATEGRSLPSLNQLDEAVQCFIEEHPGADVLVIVDTSFAHRIDPTESEIFESAYNAGEIITPPAGTIGRGDSFILKVADKLGATVFSNDSFQEFHGTYDWLFDRGRLIGGKPIPGLGWVFTDRTPVRGPRSREAVRDAKRSQVRLGSKEASRPMPVPKAPPSFVASRDEPAEAPSPRGRGRDRDRAKKRTEQVAPVVATAPARKAATAQKNVPTERPAGDNAFVNESLPFVSFVSEHLPGTEVSGLVETYASHGFYVTVGEARGYVPLRGAAEPMPRSARDVARKGEEYIFIVRAFDAERRGIELAMPGSPAALTIGSDAPADVSSGERGGRESTRESGRDSSRESNVRRGRRRRGRGKSEGSDPVAFTSSPSSTSSASSASRSDVGSSASKPRVSKKAAAAKTTAPSSKAPVSKAPVSKARKVVAKVAAKAAPKDASKVVAKKAAPAKSVSAKATPSKAGKKAATAVAAKAVGTSSPKKAVAKKAAATQKLAPAKKSELTKAAPKKLAPVVKAAPTKQAAPTKTAPTKATPTKTVPAPAKASAKAPAKKAVAKAVAAVKKAVTKSSPAKKAAAKKVGK